MADVSAQHKTKRAPGAAARSVRSSRPHGPNVSASAIPAYLQTRLGLQRQAEGQEEETLQASPSATFQRQPAEEEAPVQAKPGAGGLVQRQAEPEEEAIQTQPVSALVRRQPVEEEEPLQAKRAGGLVQPQAEPEEDALQAQPDAGVVRRQPVEEEEPVQAKPGAGGLVQRQAEPEEEAIRTRPDSGLVRRQPAEEEEPVQAKSAGGLVQRQAEPDEEVQAKLTVGPPDDAYEKQADRVAESVMRMPAAPAAGEKEEEEQAGGQGVSAVQRVWPQAKSTTGSGGASSADLHHAIRSPGAGTPLAEHVRSPAESVLGADLGHARVHSDAAANRAAGAINAKAFTHKSDIWLGAGQSAGDLGLMAHEATHVVQQTAPAISRKLDDRLQRQPAAAPGGEAEEQTAPEEMELKGVSKFDDAFSKANADWLNQQKKKRGKVRVKFGTLARGNVEVRRRGKRFKIDDQLVPLTHPALARISAEAPALAPHLLVETTGSGMLTGFVTLGRSAKTSKALAAPLKKAPDLIGLMGFDIPRLSVTNKLADGQLRVGMKDVSFKLASVFAGSFSLELVDEQLTFAGNAEVSVRGLATGSMTLERNEKGLVTGSATVAVQLAKNITGDATVDWDGENVSGKGKVGYQGEKLSGDVTVQVMDKAKATQLEQEKKAPPAETPAAAGAPAKSAAKPKSLEYVVFGEGNLNFAFTDWLTGTAHVIIDPKGHLTVIGEITPQKEFELFPQKDYNKKLFKVEARASYGIPVVGNIFIFANIGMDAFAKLGPAKFYKIKVSGTYSTDPEKSKDFRIQGSLNISAAAGLRLRGEAGAGLEILAHDIKAGAGLNALAGIRGYAEATPIIGYREKPGAPGEDKKGEFFLRGELEIAAQPFLGLGGDLFVEIDAPWWSPVPDKRWTWPLGGKEWPIGGSFGVGANVDYVFGSAQWPSLEFKKVDFDSDKFITDLYSDKAQSKSDKGEKPGKWKEKNSAAAEPPKEAKKGDAQQGKPPALPGAKPKVQPGGPKKATKPADPNAKTAEGKTVKQYQEEASKKGGKPDAKGAPKGKGEATGAGKSAEAGRTNWMKGVSVVRQALAYAEKTGIEEKELNGILKKILKRKEFGFKKLYAKENSKDKSKWIIMGAMSPDEPVAEAKKKEKKILDTKLIYFGSADRTNMAVGKPLSNKGTNGSETKRARGWPKWWKDVETFADKDDWRRVHLIHDKWGRGDKETNLVPGNTAANSAMTTYEHPAIKRTDDDEMLWYKVKVKYRTSITHLKFGYGDYFPEYIKVSFGAYDEDKGDKEGPVIAPERSIPVKAPPLPGVAPAPPPIPRKPADVEDAYKLAKEMHDAGNSWADITWAFNQDTYVSGLKAAKWQNLSRDTKKRFGES